MMNRLGYFVLGSLAGAVMISAVPRGTARPAPDALNVSPQFYTVRLENNRVRVLEYVLPAGKSEAMHSHHPGVAYVISGATLHMQMPDGSVADGTLNAGDVHWRDKNVTHAVQNVGSTDMRALLVELK